MIKPIAGIACILLFVFVTGSIYAQKPTYCSSASDLFFAENNGQIRDQFKKPRTDIRYSLRAPGMNVFIGNGQLHYQFSRQESHCSSLSQSKSNNVTKNARGIVRLQQEDMMF